MSHILRRRVFRELIIIAAISKQIVIIFYVALILILGFGVAPYSVLPATLPLNILILFLIIFTLRLSGLDFARHSIRFVKVVLNGRPINICADCSS